jgi:hypothetical protein
VTEGIISSASDIRVLDLERLVEGLRTRSASAVISLPMPSPGRTAIFIGSDPASRR